jgi:hypothetical protein
MVKPSLDNRFTGVAIDQRRAERRIGMGPADQHRQRHAVAPTLDAGREQAEQLWLRGARPDQAGTDLTAEDWRGGERKRRLVEDVRLECATGERPPFLCNGCQLGQWPPLDPQCGLDGAVHVQRPQMKTWKPSLFRVTMNKKMDSKISALAVAVAAPAMPHQGISMKQSPRLTANALA